MDWYVEFIEMCAWKNYLLLMKMAIDLIIMALVKSNLDYLCDFQMMFDLAFLLHMLIAMHSFIAKGFMKSILEIKVVIYVIFYVKPLY